LKQVRNSNGPLMVKAFSFFLICLALLTMAPYAVYGDTTYTVKKGDSLHKLSKTFKVDVDKIKEANGIESDRLTPGMKITVPTKEASRKKHREISKSLAPRSGADKGQAAAEENDTRDGLYHIVKKGDSLGSISKKYAISVSELRELNSIKKSGRLKTGQQLIVKKTGPRTYTVKKGDTMLKIAKKLDVSPEYLMVLNDLESEELSPGQKLLLEEWTAEPGEIAPYSPILSQAKITDDIKTLSESPELSLLNLKERVILFAHKMLNIPYRFGGSTFMGIDCSGYVQKVFSFLNMPLPRTAREQFRVGEPVRKEDLSMGDLVFFRTYASFPSHVGIYLGNNLFIHASSRGKKVTIDSLETPYYFRRFIGAKRLLNEEPAIKPQPETDG